MLKQIARHVNLSISWFFVSLYLKRFKPITVGVAGSIGKTGTKRAIAHILAAGKKVAWQDGNYNDLVTVPLIFFGLKQPSLFNPFAWAVTYIRMILALLSPRGVDVVVLELGTDAPGQIAAFGNYIHLDYAVVTSVSHEHMENFADLQAVAEEELAVSMYSSKVYLSETISKAGYKTPIHAINYGIGDESTIRFESRKDTINFYIENKHVGSSTTKLVGQHQFSALAIALEIALKIGVNLDAALKAIEELRSMPGRMSLIEGKDGSWLLDDTYNSSPAAVQSALDYLYSRPEKNKIAVLGNMNEMGQLSAKLHTQVGDMCSRSKLSEVITIGKDANMYLAEAARKRDCKVTTFNDPYSIGQYLLSKKLSNTIILFKGSQNGVFLEEAIKPLIINSNDIDMLVRQSKNWQIKKNNVFKEEHR